MNKPDSALCLLTAVRAAKKAGDAIMEVYNSDFAVETKEDRSPLTLADRRSHEIISDQLKGCGIPVLSEEGKDIPYEERTPWEYFWLVDPLDGTKEFIRRNGEFTVNIALIHKHSPVIGVLYVPVEETLYFGSLGAGAYRLSLSDTEGAKNLSPLLDAAASDAEDIAGRMEALVGRAEKISVSGPGRNDAGHITIAGSRSHGTGELETFLEAVKKEYKDVDFISAGSALKFCLVAEGRADIYPRFGPTMEWDTAAGQCIVEESGGEVLSLENGKPLEYNKQVLKNPRFVCRAKGMKLSLEADYS